MSSETELTPSELEARKLFAKHAETNERLAAQMAEGIVNPIVLATVIDVRPQMIYNYIQNGRIISRHSNSTQKLIIPLHEAYRFAASQIERRNKKAEQIERELRGE